MWQSVAKSSLLSIFFFGVMPFPTSSNALSLERWQRAGEAVDQRAYWERHLGKAAANRIMAADRYVSIERPLTTEQEKRAAELQKAYDTATPEQQQVVFHAAIMNAL
ncbi:MAG: hypothetical protein ACTHNE_05755 [Dyella sp.]